MNKLFSTFLLILLTIQFSGQAQELRSDWWTEARFGMFIHWGLYSGAEGIWKGEKHRHFNNYAEWIKYRNRISNEEYGELAKRFVWEDIDPEKWVIQAKKAGMQYITITAKHHDGFALWDTKVGNYSFKNYDPESRDILAELAAACKKHNMKLGFYYSHWVDWEHPYGWDHNRELTQDLSDEQFDKYWQEKVIPQLRELLTNYGDVALLWFDMWLGHEETIVQEKQLRQVISLVRELQPNCLINSRLGLPVSDPDIDYETLGDNQLGAIYQKNPWQTPGTIAHSWGYHALENDWKSTNQLLQALINNVSLNGNFMLNIGPRADGSLPYESISRLEDMGRWLEVNGASIFGAGGLELRPRQYDWGKLTFKKENGKDKIFLQVFNWPLDKTLRFTGVLTKPSKVYLLADKLQKPISHTQSGPNLHLHLPRLQPDPFVSVVVLEFDEQPELDKDVAAESSFGGVALHGGNALEKDVQLEKLDPPGRMVSPEYVNISQGQELNWKLYAIETEQKNLSISFANPGKKPIKGEILLGDRKMEIELKPTGKVVVEPNQNYYTEEFIDFPLGQFDFSEVGYHTIKFRILDKPSTTIRFNRIWIE
ncbi:Alpha-L-fucosidase [Indibacter alkaliphilus LW1]|uniref:alpha-L-fucosidase n=1 Tax=Indibacter alkaliphilus (strain CCUG 57479 / KCTC 22604 / LW1) TaxID=1189612 RepID=S2E462_INDAL|nr:alpha-L-fucosidase [Indibacter alkaliphilus]EOZ97003.1 Alpha-L-fucosidase [Indibacter alkaliphilus LW1]